jgi:hypothetical protein
MKIYKTRYLLLNIGFFFLLFVYAACDGIFPSQTKPNMPSDHTSSFGGFLHASIRRGQSAGGCKSCHGQDLKGQVYNFNGNLVVTQSCYECHANIWDGNGGNGGNK